MINLDRLTEWCVGWKPLQYDKGTVGPRVLIKAIETKYGNQIITIHCEANIDDRTVRFSYQWGD